MQKDQLKEMIQNIIYIVGSHWYCKAVLKLLLLAQSLHRIAKVIIYIRQYILYIAGSQCFNKAVTKLLLLAYSLYRISNLYHIIIIANGSARIAPKKK